MIHRISIIMILLIWLHVSLITRISLLPFFPKAFDLYTVFFLGIYAVVKIRQRIGTNAELVKNVELSSKVQQLTFMLKKPEKVEAGDFFFVSLRGSGISAEFHPLSITNDPDDGRKLVFTIQRTGDWSKKVDQISVGTLAYLEGPFGQFEKIIEKDRKTQPLILYGLGSGISPLLSIAEKYVKSRDITLLWSSAGEKLYYHSKIENLKKNSAYFQAYEREHRFTRDDLNEILTSNDIENGLFIVVGSANVLLQVEKNLKSLGVKSKQIVDERLTM